jgi:hypothetical protein
MVEMLEKQTLEDLQMLETNRQRGTGLAVNTQLQDGKNKNTIYQ